MAVNRSVVADPDKVANVWHLATAEPERLETSAAGEAVNDFLDPPDTSQIHGIACHADWRFAARAGAVRRRYEGATRAHQQSAICHHREGMGRARLRRELPPPVRICPPPAGRRDTEPAGGPLPDALHHGIRPH